MTPEAYRSLLETWAAAAAERYGIPVAGYLALIGRESAWDPAAVSPAGAMGLAQLMPITATEMGVTDPFDPQQSLDAGAAYLAITLGRVNAAAPLLSGPARWASVLGAYNWGIGNWQDAYDQHGDAWICVSPPETARYVDALTEAFEGRPYPVACGGPRNPDITWPAIALMAVALALA